MPTGEEKSLIEGKKGMRSSLGEVETRDGLRILPSSQVGLECQAKKWISTSGMLTSHPYFSMSHSRLKAFLLSLTNLIILLNIKTMQASLLSWTASLILIRAPSPA